MVEKITVVRKKFKKVEDGYEQIQVFKTSDGKLFNDEYLANNRQKIIDKNNVNKIFETIIKIDLYNIADLPLTWYYASNETELYAIKKYFELMDTDGHGVRKATSFDFEIKDWYSGYIDEDRDYGNTIYVYKWSDVIREFKNCLKRMKNERQR